MRIVCLVDLPDCHLFVTGGSILTSRHMVFLFISALAMTAYEDTYLTILDVDGPEDLELAEWYIKKHKVFLPEIA